jgi:lipoprotein-anchoring transpeptidase ErfK/SrfK
LKGSNVIKQILVVLAALVMLALSATMAWATVADYNFRGIVPEGVTIEGESLGGMTADEAGAKIEEVVAAPLLRPVTVVTEKGTLTCDPNGIVSVGVEEMLAQAYDARLGEPFVARLSADWWRPVDRSVEVTYSVDRAKIEAWVAEMSKDIDRPAIDATIGISPQNKMVMKKSREGRRVKQDYAVNRIAKAMVGEEKTVKLPIRKRFPKVTEDDFGKTIIVDVSERRLTLWNKDKVERTWLVAVGGNGFSTPQGKWEIVLKRYMPTWVNPGSPWAKDMPKTIPPGPSNPLGMRALNLNAAGIRIHGTTKISSIGTAASHGCIRMINANVIELFDLVDEGTTVYVVP